MHQEPVPTDPRTFRAELELHELTVLTFEGAVVTRPEPDEEDAE